MTIAISKEFKGVHPVGDHRRARAVTNMNLPTAQLTTAVDRATYNTFDALAYRQRKTKGALLREVIENYLREHAQS